jgi:hypothetical protein
MNFIIAQLVTIVHLPLLSLSLAQVGLLLHTLLTPSCLTACLVPPDTTAIFEACQPWQALAKRGTIVLPAQR